MSEPTDFEDARNCRRFALSLPPGRAFNEFGGNFVGRLHTLKTERDEFKALYENASNLLDKARTERTELTRRLTCNICGNGLDEGPGLECMHPAYESGINTDFTGDPHE